MARAKVVVLGGGFGGLEATFYLRYKLGDEVSLVLVSDRDYFVFKPNTIYIPFGADPAEFVLPLKRPTGRANVELIIAPVTGLDTDNKLVFLTNQSVDYDYLVIATGADMRPSEVPGLKEHGVTVWTPEEMLKLRHSLEHVVEQAKGGNRQRILFLVPPNNKCSGPLYELCLMADTWLVRQGIRDRVELIWATYEQSYIQSFGPRLDTVVAREFEERGIEGYRGVIVTNIEPNVAHFQGGFSLRFDLLVAFPPYVAKHTYGSLSSDERGFVKVEPESMRVKGQNTIFAVGDASDFPIKQAFLALLQADAAADHIAAELTGKRPELNFEPMSMCVMEELNRATFAQVPLKYTGDPLKPIDVNTGDLEHYKVGVSPIWRLGKKVLGIYAPWRFGHGKPFHAGFAWEAMDVGLKVMSKLFSD